MSKLKRTPLSKGTKGLKQTALKVGKFKPKTKRKKKNPDLESYFSHHLYLLHLYSVSEASKQVIYEPSTKNICHIFPKRKYKSIESNVDNCVYLTWEEHQQFDDLMDVFDLEGVQKKFPELWPKIWKRAQNLLPLIKESGKLKEAFEIYAQTISE